MKQLKDNFRSLHNFLLNSHGFQKQLSNTVKQISNDVKQQRLDMDRFGTQQFSDNTLIGELKRELLKMENEHILTQERCDKLKEDLEESATGINELNKEIEEIQRHKAAMLEPQLIAATKELRVTMVLLQNTLFNHSPPLFSYILARCTATKESSG